MEKKGKITVVVGGQWGSEAKGLFCSHLALRGGVTMSARTGSINAGHTVYFKGGEFKNQQIPVAWINPEVKLVIGAGAYVHIETLEREIAMIEKATGEKLVHRLYIDTRAGLHDGSHKEQSAGRHERFGTVGEGVSAAICARLRREAGVKLFKNTEWAEKNNGILFKFADTVAILNEEYDKGGHILIEGTQGTLLDVYLGDYPFTTSRQAVASSWLAECGLAPTLNIEVAMVCRTFPIRVAGNSGPMPAEIAWSELAQEINKKRSELGLSHIVNQESIDQFTLHEALWAKNHGMPDSSFELWSAEERAKFSKELVEVHKEVLLSLRPDYMHDLRRLFETTTVTKKLRRIARLDFENLYRAIRINRPTYLVFNFLNYKFPSLFTFDFETAPDKQEIQKYIEGIEEATGTFVRFINWKPNQMYEYRDATCTSNRKS